MVGQKLPNPEESKSPIKNSDLDAWGFSPDQSVKNVGSEMVIENETNITKLMEKGKAAHGFKKLAPKNPLKGKLKEADERMAALFEETDNMSPENSIAKSNVKSKILNLKGGPSKFQ